MAGRIDHQVHVVADALTGQQDGACFAFCVAIVPAVDLKAAKALLFAGQGIIGHCFRTIHPARLFLRVIGAGIGREPFAISAQHAGDRHVMFFAGEIPQRNVQHAVAHMVISADLALQVVVDLDARFGVAAQQVGGQHLHLPQRRRGADPVGDIFALCAIIAADAYGKTLGFEFATREVDQIAHPGGCMFTQPQIVGFKGKEVNFNTVDRAHKFARFFAGLTDDSRAHWEPATDDR